MRGDVGARRRLAPTIAPVRCVELRRMGARRCALTILARRYGRIRVFQTDESWLASYRTTGNPPRPSPAIAHKMLVTLSALECGSLLPLSTRPACWSCFGSCITRIRSWAGVPLTERDPSPGSLRSPPSPRERPPQSANSGIDNIPLRASSQAEKAAASCRTPKLAERFN
jgi:hypothetical protein